MTRAVAPYASSLFPSRARGVAKPNELGRQFADWLGEALLESRWFEFVEPVPSGSGAAVQVDGELLGRVSVRDEHVKVSVRVLDNERRRVTAASVELPRALLDDTLIGDVKKRDKTTPDGATGSTTDDDDSLGVVQLLDECEGHAKGERWTDAWDCYGKVLERDAGNDAVEKGREEIERGYGERIREALARWDFVGAMGIVKEYRGLEPDSGRIRARIGEWEKEIAGAKVFQDCDSCPEMVVIPAGRYEMGSPEWEVGRDESEDPVHWVTIAEPLAVGVYEVTFAEWDACVSEGGCYGSRPDDRGWGRGRRPVVNVSWEDARAYVGWLSRKTRQGYRLLSESEWEYAARAGTTSPFHYGGTVSTEQANYAGDSTYGSGRKGEYRKRTLPVGTFPPNEFGLHDVHGNVSEWVEDCWNGSYRGAPRDGGAWTSRGSCDARVLRGGSWFSRPRRLRSANRGGNATAVRFDFDGFRVARTFAP